MDDVYVAERILRKESRGASITTMLAALELKVAENVFAAYFA